MMYTIKKRLRTLTIRTAGIIAGVIAVYAAIQLLGFTLRAFISQRPVLSILTGVSTNVMAKNYPDVMLSQAKSFATGYMRQAYQAGSPLGEEAARQVIDRNLIGRALVFAYHSAYEVGDCATKALVYSASTAARYAWDNAPYCAAYAMRSASTAARYALDNASHYAASAARRSRYAFSY